MTINSMFEYFQHSFRGHTILQNIIEEHNLLLQNFGQKNRFSMSKKTPNILKQNLQDKSKYIDQRLYRQHCRHNNGLFIKDLNDLGRDLKDVIIIDNSAIAFRDQPENAIHIKSFLFDNTDKELLRLIPFLLFMSNVYDVRQISG